MLIKFNCYYLASNAMDFEREVVDKVKIENEKSTQKRQFRHSASKNVHRFWARNECSKTNYN